MRVSRYKLILALLDFTVLLLSYYGVYYFTYEVFYSYSENILFLILGLVIVSICIFNFQANNLYKVNVFLTRALQLSYLIKSYFYSLLLILLVLFILGFPFKTDSRYFLFLFFTLSFLLIFIYRTLLIRPLFNKLLENSKVKTKIAIIGAGKSGKFFVTKFLVENLSALGYDIVGFYDDNIPTNTQISEKLKVLGTIQDLINSRNGIEEVIISIDNISYEKLIELIEKLNTTGLMVKLNTELFRTIDENLFIEKIGALNLINTTPAFYGKYMLLFKKIFDKFFALCGLILLAPFLILVALIIKLTSKGPVFYKQKRIGLNGKPFNFLKFRSMTVSNEDDEERKKRMIEFMKGNYNSHFTKIINEQRVTTIGKFLRKYSLDELPQLINVLKGDMSLVGPRPCLPYEYENYEEWQKKRTSVLPGCTGIWQVYGRSKVDFKDSVIMDLYYINNMSPWLDLQLIIKTIPVLITGKGGK